MCKLLVVSGIKNYPPCSKLKDPIYGLHCQSLAQMQLTGCLYPDSQFSHAFLQSVVEHQGGSPRWQGIQMGKWEQFKICLMKPGIILMDVYLMNKPRKQQQRKTHLSKMSCFAAAVTTAAHPPSSLFLSTSSNRWNWAHPLAVQVIVLVTLEPHLAPSLSLDLSHFLFKLVRVATQIRQHKPSYRSSVWRWRRRLRSPPLSPPFLLCRGQGWGAGGLREPPICFCVLREEERGFDLFDYFFVWFLIS